MTDETTLTPEEQEEADRELRELGVPALAAADNQREVDERVFPALLKPGGAIAGIQVSPLTIQTLIVFQKLNNPIMLGKPLGQIENALEKAVEVLTVLRLPIMEVSRMVAANDPVFEDYVMATAESLPLDRVDPLGLMQEIIDYVNAASSPRVEGKVPPEIEKASKGRRSGNK